MPCNREVCVPLKPPITETAIPITIRTATPFRNLFLILPSDIRLVFLYQKCLPLPILGDEAGIVLVLRGYPRRAGSTAKGEVLLLFPRDLDRSGGLFHCCLRP